MTIVQELKSYHTLIDALAAAPRALPFATMWEANREPMQETVTFGQFLELATGYAALYQARGLGPGDTVVLVMPQSLALLEAFAGAIILGAVPTILAYPTFKVEPEKYRYGLVGVTRNLKARLTIIDQDFPEALAACLEGMETARLDPMNLPKVTDVIWAAPRPDDVAFIQHSAGTTGLQKGVALSHRSVLTQLIRLGEALDLHSADRIVSWLPIYHDMGLIACFILPLVGHLPLVMQSPTDWVLCPVSFLQIVNTHRSTLCWLPNFAYQFMARRVHEDDRRDLDLSSLRAVINCSEPVRAQSMEEFFQAYRAQGFSRSALQSSYAMAENTFAVTQSVLDGGATPLTVYVDRDKVGAGGSLSFVSPDSSAAQAFVSSGRCLKGNRVQVVDENGQELPDKVIGEILVQSDSLFSGYYNRPDLTEQALRAGWYWTKDRGFKIGEELFVLGRKDDMIIIGGRNIYPLDVEEIAWTNPHIREGRVIAFGVDNPNLGTQELFVVAEVGEESDLEQAQEIQLDIRRRILNEVAVAPRIVQLVPPKWIVKSTAGKPARSTSRVKFFKEHPELDPARTEEEEETHG
jgi:fatty-acyl-CoA synthase